jgi:hypothetical protein
VFATLMTLVTCGATAIAVAPPRPIPVAVTAPARPSKSLLQRIFAEAEAIWEPVGITFDWHPVVSTERPREWQLALTIENPHDRLAEWQAPLGWISFAARTPDCRIHLSQPSAEELVRSTPTALDSHGCIPFLLRQTGCLSAFLVFGARLGSARTTRSRRNSSPSDHA